MRKFTRAAVAALLLQGPGVMMQAHAQVPPHIPGSICFTPQFWCWSPTPGNPGGPCACPTPYGWVGGRLG